MKTESGNAMEGMRLLVSVSVFALPSPSTASPHVERSAKMNHDIQKVKDEVHALFPDVEVRQLQCVHAADDDGIWFFSGPGKKEEIQLESSTGDLPFIVEHTHTNSGEARTVETIDEAVQIIRTFFQQIK